VILADATHNTILVFEVTILVLAIFLGIEVISKVPTLLHTPLMSGTNAIHGIVIVGAMIVLGLPDKSTFTWIVGFAAVVLASANVVGGFVVTDRMLEMFKKRERPAPKEPVRETGPVEGVSGEAGGSPGAQTDGKGS
jgi:NAD(P) transhydrogenase subunit alpha